MLITKIWKELPGKYFCISTRDAFKAWKDHFFKKNEFDQIREFIEENQDKDVYWCPHGFNKQRRLKQYAEIPNILWADLDEVDPSELGDLMPTIAWQSSPGRYCGIWKIDTFMTEELNQRLTNHIKADPGGWDLTQVLRVPGTKNYKYAGKPVVKSLWSDGDEYTTAFIEKKLPKIKTKKHDGTDAKAIYKKYEKKFSTFVRRELINGKPIAGKRSEVIWKLAHEIIEAGATTDEAFELLRVSPWNKFRERRDGDKQLRRELDKALTQHLNVSVNNKKTFKEEEEENDEEEDEEQHVFLAKSMEDVEIQNMDWIWYPYLARGELTILEGDPGLGKSYMAQMVAAAIVDGKRLPSEKMKRSKGRVAYFDLENSAGTVTKKRLVNNGCVNLADYYQDEEHFSIDDIETLKRVHKAITKLKPSLVVFDTVNTYIGSIDTHKASDVQQAMKNFVEIARRHNCAVMVLRHLTKSKDTAAIYRGQGSIAFTGMARVVMTVGKHPDEEDVRVMAVTKINVTRKPKALTFTINKLEDKLQDQDRSEFVWGDWIDITSDELMVIKPAKTRESTEDVQKFLEDQLEEGPQEAEIVIRAAEARGIGKRNLYRVMEDMQISKTKVGFGSKAKSVWSMGNSTDKKKKNKDLDD